jgi:hypothetical protein
MMRKKTWREKNACLRQKKLWGHWNMRILLRFKEKPACVFEQECRRHPPRKMVEQETESLVLGPVTVREDLHDAFSKASNTNYQMVTSVMRALSFTLSPPIFHQFWESHHSGWIVFDQAESGFLGWIQELSEPGDSL